MVNSGIIGRGSKTMPRGARLACLASAFLIAVAAFAPATAWAFSPTLAEIRSRGLLLCGVNQGLPGFASVDDQGRWSGFDVDFCRAIAAAALGNPEKVKFAPLAADARFEALRDGKIDVLSRNSTWTLSRETEYGLSFVSVTYYDGQGFLLPRKLKVTSALELDGATVCVQSGTTTIDNLQDFFDGASMHFEPVIAASPEDAIKKYEAGLCSVLTSDLSQLYALRQRLTIPKDHVILPDVISKEPLGPAVRQSDPQWADIVRWVHFAMVDGEELGVGTKTIGQALSSQKPEVMRLVGARGDFGARLGLSNSWAANVLRMVGNHGEVFERNVGVNSPLGIPRGLNQLWTMGGIQYAPPIR
jgi:general L-amino acid transport system substrate-binding protein